MSNPRDQRVNKSSEPSTTNEDVFPNPFALTRLQIILFAVSLIFAYDRTSDLKLLPFEVGLLGGIILPECLIWSLLIGEMAVKDLLHLYGDLAWHA